VFFSSGKSKLFSRSILDFPVLSFLDACLQVWQLKSFWHDFPHVEFLKDNDVEFQRFRNTELSPPIRLSEIEDPMVLAVVCGDVNVCLVCM
jgi:hypothetical protein